MGKKSRFPFSFYVNKENSGPSISRKNGVEKSKGTYIVFMDDDDYYINVNAFSKGIAMFDKYSNLSFVSGDSLLEDVNNNKLKYEPLNYHGFIEKEEYLTKFQIKYSKPRSTFSTIFSKSKLEESGAFEMEMFNDSVIYMRALLTGDAFITEDVWGVYYIHDSNISKTIDCEFIMENMREKYDIYKIMVKQGYNDEEWIVKHFNLTIKYFFSGANTKNVDVLINWINNIEDKSIRRKLRKSFYKQLIKNRLKKVLKG